jgi:hypothetical protein
MFKLVFFVPRMYAEEVKLAIFDAGGGRYQKYDFCAWQTEGTGQFRPLPESDPFIGQPGQVELVQELRIEVLLGDEMVLAVVRALLNAHPYEEPAYEVYRVYHLPELEEIGLPAGVQ